MTCLAEFILARIAEDENDPWRGAELMGADRIVGAAEADALREEQREWESRVLAECEAKRRIVGQCAPSSCSGAMDPAEAAEWERTNGLERTPHWPDGYAPGCDGCSSAQDCDAQGRAILRSLAAVYVDHADYDQRWAR